MLQPRSFESCVWTVRVVLCSCTDTTSVVCIFLPLSHHHAMQARLKPTEGARVAEGLAAWSQAANSTAVVLALTWAGLARLT